MSDHMMNQFNQTENGVPAPRRRRSARYEENENILQNPQTPVDATRVSPQIKRHEVPEGETRAVPRPISLNQAEGVRRPVNAPGYNRQQSVDRGFITPTRNEGAPIPQPAFTRQPVRYDLQTEENNQEVQEKPRKRHTWLIVLVCIVLLLGIASGVLLMLPESVGGALGTARNVLADTVGGLFGLEKAPVAPQLMNVSTINTQGNSPLNAIFNVTTDKTAEGIRLVDENGEVLQVSYMPATENEDSRIWIINLPVADRMECEVKIEALSGENWFDGGKSQIMAIVPATPTPQPTYTPTPAPTQAPTPQLTPEVTAVAVVAAVQTEAPTAIPTATPTVVPTPAPTEVVTLPPTSTPTLAPTPAPTGTPVPTAVPTATPTFTPVPTPVPTATPEPTATPTPAPTAAPVLEPQAMSDLGEIVAEAVLYDNTKKLTSFERDEEIFMNGPEDYTVKAGGKQYGVLTFRGSSFRQNAAVGNVKDISSMSVKWTAEAGSVQGASSTYYGIGHTGQPAIIKWSKEIREFMNLFDDKKATPAIKEVIVAGLDGKIYFLDLADGTPTRDAINVGYPMKGSVSLHSSGYPLLTVGQYARKMKSGTGNIGLRVFNLMDQSQTYMFDGLDGKLNRPYNEVGAFETSALFDRNTDTMIAVGTNGALYVAKMNTELDRDVGSLKIEPKYNLFKTRLGSEKKSQTAVEASPVMYGGYVYYADLAGWLRCVDVNTMKVVWGTKLGDAVEGSLALDFDENGKLWLYVANTLQNRSKGTADIRRFDAATGKEDWTVSVGVKKDTSKNKTKVVAGAMASPLIGQNEIADLAIFTISNLSAEPGITLDGATEAKNAAAAIVAVNKTTGKVEWARELDSYSYSSPVAVYDEDGTAWVIQCASSGTIYLLKGTTGEVVNTLEVEGTIDASPAVYGSTMVIGTTGKNTSYIYGIALQ